MTKQEKMTQITNSADRNLHTGSLLLTWVNFNPSMDKLYIQYIVWVEITYPFLYFNGATVEV